MFLLPPQEDSSYLYHTFPLSFSFKYVPHYFCKIRCVGGYSVGGGLALTSRLLGLNTDVVIEFRVVGANGEVLVANANENSDLFWGLRGGSGINLGIVTSILFQGKKMPKQILGGHLSFDMTADAAEALAGTMYDLIWGAGDPENMRPFGFSIGWVPSDDDPQGASSF